MSVFFRSWRNRSRRKREKRHNPLPDRAGVFGVFCIVRNPARKDSPANDRKKRSNTWRSYWSKVDGMSGMMWRGCLHQTDSLFGSVVCRIFWWTDICLLPDNWIKRVMIQRSYIDSQVLWLSVSIIPQRSHHLAVNRSKFNPSKTQKTNIGNGILWSFPLSR